MEKHSVIVWFRRDLRVADNPALAEAAAAGAVVPVYIWSPEEDGEWAPGDAARWWLARSLEALGRDLQRRGGRLIVRRGPSLDALRELTQETGARGVYWNRLYEPAAIARDKKVERELVRDGLEVKTFNASLLIEPDELRTKQGGVYRVFTPFWRAVMERVGECNFEFQSKLKFELRTENALRGENVNIPCRFEPKRPADWIPGEAGAKKQLDRFIKNHLENYPVGRDRPDWDGTSRLSPHLHFGEIGPRQVVGRVCDPALNPGVGSQARPTTAFIRQLVWREFAHYLLFHFPNTPAEPLRPEFGKFEWKMDKRKFEAWKQGRTGYPIVDAGMRQLIETGWMHNRVRMIVASFLVKDLMIPWQAGARYFWETLVDADLANNTLGWQWVAGCGADAAPFFRIYNPGLQAKKFDPDGEYARRWAGAEIKPIVDHRAAAMAAMAAYRRFKRG
ncbi:MAG: deoxyribodipyrimidine photo-lyase [Candidatus Sumerlaeia bacterium]